MSEIRRSSDGVELGPRVPDGRSYDERQIASGPRPEPRIYYQDEAVTLWLGDCRDVFHKLMRVDLVLTDPPYGIGEAAKNHVSRGKPLGSNGAHRQQKAYATDWGKSDWDDRPPSDDLIAEAIAFGKHAIVFGGNYFKLPPSPCWLVWDKDNGASDFADCELAWTNLKKAVRKLTYRWNGMLQEPGMPKEQREHPTQKPEPVIRWALLQAPQTAQTILDPFAGSGTTGVAAKRLGRKAILIEREEKYCAVAARRLSQGALNLEFVS